MFMTIPLTLPMSNNAANFYRYLATKHAQGGNVNA
jgi:hypothetical protein